MTKTWTSPNAPTGPLTDLTLGPDGELLIASGEGLRRFDGISFTPWPPMRGIPESHGWQATAVMVANNGDVWVGYRGEGVEVRRGESLHAFRFRDHPTLRFVRGFWEDNAGSIWIASEGGLALARGKDLIPQPTPPGQVVYRIKSSPRTGLPWLATDLGLYEMEHGKYKPILDRRHLADSRVRDFVFDRDGHLWIATMGGLVDWSTNAARVYGKSDGLANDWVRRLLIDRTGRLWAACLGGVSWKNGDRFESLAERGTTKRPDVTAIERGPGGELWLATSSGDLLRLSMPSFTLIENAADPNNSQLLSISEDNSGHLWLGWNYYGLTETLTGANHTIRQLEDRPLNRPIALAPARAGGIWCTGTDAKLFRAQNGKTFYEIIPGWPDGTALSTVLEDYQGRLWVGSFEHGLARRAGATWSKFDKSTGLLGERVVALHEDSHGTFWAASDGLYVLKHDSFVRVPETSDNPFGEITCLQSDTAGDLWVGTHGDGLFVLNDGRWKQFKRSQGLVEDIIYGIVDGGGDQLWVQGPRSIARLSKSKIKSLNGNRRSQIAPDSWLLSEQGVHTGTGPRQPTACRLRNGQLVFVTTGGAAKFEPDTPGDPFGITRVRLDRILLDGQNIEASTPANIPAGIRRIGIHWSAVNLSRPESLRSRHRLIGLESDWVEETNLHEARYGSLPAGDYRFELEVRNAGDSWRQAITPVLLHQLPRWHQTTAVRLSVIASLLILWWIVHRVRVGQIERQLRLVEAERHRIAGELHDTVEQGLAGIAINLDAASRQLARVPAQAETFLASARRLLIRSRDEARQSIWELRSVSRPTNLVSNLEQATRDLVVGTGMTWEVKAQGLIPDLPEEMLRKILRLALEAVTNAAKHSQGRHLRVETLAAADHFLLRISDDGRGFILQSTPIANHYGLELMRARADQLGGELVITTAPGNGACVELRIPLPIRNKTSPSSPARDTHASSATP